MENDPSPPAPDLLPLSELETAFARDQFFLVYQPTIDLRSNGFAGVEALLRLRRPVGAPLAPNRFMPTLVESDLVVAIGGWVLMTASLQGALWHAKGYRFSVSVNIADRQFHDAHFVDDVTHAVTVSRIPSGALTLEVATRTLTRDRFWTAQCLERLHGLGVRLAVDDADATDATLDALSDLAIDGIKLSRQTVQDLASEPTGGAATHNFLAAARARGLQVVASGIEDAEQRRQLQLEDVVTGQGFLFSPAREVADIDRLLEDYALFTGEPL